MSDHAQHYFVPQPSHWMIVGSFALLFMAAGAAMWFNGADIGRYGVLVGFALLVYMMFRWFGDVVRESEGGKYGKREDVSFRWGMSWFIFSEVMFFAAFFGALFYTRVLSVPDLGSLLSRKCCGRISAPSGRARVRASRTHSRRWRPGAFPRSTPCCC